MVAPTLSLRERSKAKRRAAIQRAAMRLFAERGYDGATIADIAEQVELAPRTVTMYFPTKLDLAMSTAADIAARLIATFEANPDLAFTEAIDRWLAGEAKAADPELVALTRAMFDANPALRAISSTKVAETVNVATSALLTETGLRPDDPMAAIITAAASAATAAYLTLSSRNGTPDTLRESFIRCLSNIINAAKT